MAKNNSLILVINKFVSEWYFYVLLYAFLCVLISSILSTSFAVRSEIDWILVGIYLILTLAPYFFFASTSIKAKRLEHVLMAFGFFLIFIGLFLVVVSLILDMPLRLTRYTSGLLSIIGSLCSGFGSLAWKKNRHERHLNMLHESMTDALTGLSNRRAFAVNSSRELKFSGKTDSDLTLMILDIDNFKPINDEFGHIVGDEVLQQISDLLNHYVRGADSVYRWGGEEFVILMPMTNLSGAGKLAHKIREKIAAKNFQVESDLVLKITVSIGVAQWTKGEILSNETLVRADEAMYEAKANGKNKVVVADFIDNHNTNT